MIDKDVLLSRLAQMAALPIDWDGWGTEPITASVYRICKRIVEIVNPNIEFLRVYVGVNNPGSAFVELSTGLKFFEFTVTPSGTIHFNEIINGEQVGGGIFLLSAKKLTELLS